MARIRSIKPEFFTSETLARVPKSARLTFIGLWTYADDNGVGLDNFRLIAAALYPLEEDVVQTLADVADELQTLEKVGVIQRYSAAGKRLFFVTSWDEHQKISHPAKPRYFRPMPGPGNPAGPHPFIAEMTSPETLRQSSGNFPETLSGPENGTNSDGCLSSNGEFDRAGDESGSTAGQTAFRRVSGESPETLRPEQGAGSREQGKEQGARNAHAPGGAEPEPLPLASLAEVEPGFADFWAHWPRKSDKAPAEKAFAKAIKKERPAVIVEACRAYAERCREVQQDPQFIPLAATWLNKERWNDDLDAAMPLRVPPQRNSNHEGFKNPDPSQYRGTF